MRLIEVDEQHIPSLNRIAHPAHIMYAAPGSDEHNLEKLVSVFVIAACCRIPKHIDILLRIDVIGKLILIHSHSRFLPMIMLANTRSIQVTIIA